MRVAIFTRKTEVLVSGYARVGIIEVRIIEEVLYTYISQISTPLIVSHLPN